MSLIDKARNIAVGLLDPNYHEKTTEADEIRTRHAAQGGVLKNQWYRLSRPDGKVVGFSYSCKCGTEYKLFSAFEWLRDYRCTSCGARFDLLGSVGLSASSPIADLVPALANLPARPHVAGPDTRQRFVDTWAQSDDGAGYEIGDPGKGGPGF